MINNLSIAVHAFGRCKLRSLSVDEILLLRYVNRSTNFMCLPLKQMSPFLKTRDLGFMCVYVKPTPSVASSRLCCKDSVWTDVSARIASLSA